MKILNYFLFYVKQEEIHNNNILINFKRHRHMNLVETLVKKPDIPFNLKKIK